MPPKRKSSKAAGEKNPNIPKDIADMVDRAWPDGIVEPFFREDSWFWEAQNKIETNLRSIKGAYVSYNRAPTVERNFHDDDDDDFPDDTEGMEEDRSYYLYFLTPEGKDFKYETEEELDLEAYDEEVLEQLGIGEDGKVEGQGEIGITVGVSLVAKVAMVVPMRREWFENGDADDPSLEFGVGQTDDGQLVPDVEDYQKSLRPEAFQELEKLKDKIVGILEVAKIHVLRREEWKQVLTGFRADQELAMDEETVTVKDAFFFRDIC